MKKVIVNNYFGFSPKLIILKINSFLTYFSYMENSYLKTTFQITHISGSKNSIFVSGYVYNFEIYTGALPERLPFEPDIGAVGNVVIRLCQIILADNHKRYYNNYYSPIALSMYLYKRNILTLGT